MLQKISLFSIYFLKIPTKNIKQQICFNIDNKKMFLSAKSGILKYYLILEMEKFVQTPNFEMIVYVHTIKAIITVCTIASRYCI